MKWLVPAAALLAGGCGYIGPPQPPARAIPNGIKNLTVAEYGDKLDITFTIPPLDTDGLALNKLRAVNVYAGTNGPPYTPESWAATAKVYSVPATMPGVVQFDQIPVSEWAGKTISVGARVTGSKGKVSGFSNLVSLSVGPALATPAGLEAKNLKEGVSLTWRGGEPKFRVLRSAAGGPLQPLADVDKPEYLDSSAQFKIAYQYRVIAMANDAYLSEPSAAASVTPEDVFPPEVPAGVTAIAGVSSIEVSWDASTEADFRGYNVYRSVDNGPFTQVAATIEMPSYSDTMIQAGKSYRYQISAVDLLNNQSARSAPVEARLP